MKRLIFKIAIGLLAFWIITSGIFFFTGLEFVDSNHELIFEYIRFWGIPICIMSTLLWTIKTNHSIGEKALILTSTTVVTMVVLVIMAISIIGNMCEWTDQKVLFTSATNKNVKIIERNFGCGATDSSDPTVENFVVKEYTKYFKVAKQVDINELDLTNWVKSRDY